MYTIQITAPQSKSSSSLELGLDSQNASTSTPPLKSFTCEAGQNILDAALAAGIQLPYACKTGGCGSCKGKIIDGDWQTSSNHLNTSEKNEGYALLCSTQPCSDLVIEAQVVEGLADIPIRKLPARVKEITLLKDDIIRLDLQLPVQQSFNFLSGQYIDILLKDGARRSYSIANLPHEGFLELHIRHLVGGLFTDALFKNQLNKAEEVANVEDLEGDTPAQLKIPAIPSMIPPIKIKDILRIEGPLGTFFLRESERPIIFLASGTGFAPIQSILKSMLQQKIERPAYLYWGGRKAKDIYAYDFCQALAENHPWFKFIPVLSDYVESDHVEENHVDGDGENNKWAGRLGFVHQAVLADFADLSTFEVYACGAPAMIQAAQHDFKQKGLDETLFFADAFTNASTNASTNAATNISTNISTNA